jgi:hypothetical protein
MPFGFPLALIALAQASAAATPAAAPAATPTAAATAAAHSKPAPVPPPNRPDGCGAQPLSDARTIVVCAPKPQGYRIDPDVLEARREAHDHVRPQRPGYQTMQVDNCATVGPMGCRGQAGIDLLGAAAMLAEMAQRASQGGNVGQMFVTDPQESEYQLYVDAKKRREAKEAQDAAAKAKAAALKSGAAAATPPRTGPVPPTTATASPPSPPAASH